MFADFFFSSRRRHTRYIGDWSSDVCSSDLTTVDARMMEFNATTGQLCPDFGQAGVLDVKVGMGEVRPGFYYLTSAPTVVRSEERRVGKGCSSRGATHVGGRESEDVGEGTVT